MKFIQKLFNKNNLIYFVIAACGIADAFFFYSKGLTREASTNSAYLEFIKSFPASIASVRVEPLFIVLSYYLSKITASNILTIVILKNLIIPFQLFVFYKTVKLFIKNNFLAVLSVIFLNFSFAYISMADNLLRNHLANLFLLVSLYFIFKLFKVGNLKKSEIIIASLSGGILIYTHILPAILLDFTLISSISFLILFTLLKKNNFIASKIQINQPDMVLLKTIALTTILIFSIQAPYIKRLATNSGIGDYQTISPATPQTTISNDNNGPVDSLTENTSSKILTGTAKTFRIIFEYRLPGFSIFFMFLSFLSILFLFTKILNLSAETPLLILWGLAYFGAKADLIFGIGTLPYRFSLMLIFPALLSLIIFLEYLVKKIQNNEGRIFLLIMLVIAFIGINLPAIAETTLLKDFNNDAIKKIDLEEMYAEMKIKKDGNVFLINGDSLEESGSTSKYLRNNTLFSTTNQEQILSSMQANNINYIIFDNNRIGKDGNDLSSPINTNIETFKTSPYFKNLGEYLGETGTHTTIFEFIPAGNTTNAVNANIFNCDEDDSCAEKFTNEIEKSNSPIKKWSIEIYQNDKNIQINEYARFENGQFFNIKYKNNNFKNDTFSKGATIALKDIQQRKNTTPITTLRSESGIMLLRSSGIKISYLNLEKLSIDNLTISGTLTNNTITYLALTRKGYTTLVHIIFFLLIITTYIIFLAYQKKRQNIFHIFDFSSKINSCIILTMIMLLLIDLIAGNMIFVEIYKKLIGAQQ